jgi:hypothetical protein
MAINVANNQSLTAITALPSGVSGGAMTLLETQTASSSATLSFTSGIDDTYDEYVFKYTDIHPATDSAEFSFQVDTGTNTSYNQTITSTAFQAYHNEGDSAAGVDYDGSFDQAQGSAFNTLTKDAGNDNDQSCSGFLHLYAPSSTTFVKHFIANASDANASDYMMHWFAAGYINTTTAITRVQFKFSSGNIDAGTIKLYGIS